MKSKTSVIPDGYFRAKEDQFQQLQTEPSTLSSLLLIMKHEKLFAASNAVLCNKGL